MSVVQYPLLEQQSLGLFLEARDRASDLIVESTNKPRILSFEEGLLLQASSLLLTKRENLHGYKLMEENDFPLVRFIQC